MRLWVAEPVIALGQPRLRRQRKRELDEPQGHIDRRVGRQARHDVLAPRSAALWLGRTCGSRRVSAPGSSGSSRSSADLEGRLLIPDGSTPGSSAVKAVSAPKLKLGEVMLLTKKTRETTG